MTGRVSFFSLGVDDVERARAFYGGLFGWTFSDGPTGGAVIEGSNVPAGIHGGDPGADPYLFLDVDDIDAALVRVHELGGKVEVHDSDDSAETVARFGRFALCRDDQGSTFGLHQAPTGGDVDVASDSSNGVATNGVAADLVGILDAWLTAIVANDAERIGAVMSDDWVIVSESGVSPRQQFLSLVASGELTHSAMSRTGPARVRVHGDAAVLTARVVNTAHYGGQRFDADEWTTDVFVRRDGRWLCVLSHITAATAGDPTDG